MLLNPKLHVKVISEKKGALKRLTQNQLVGVKKEPLKEVIQMYSISAAATQEPFFCLEHIVYDSYKKIHSQGLV